MRVLLEEGPDFPRDTQDPGLSGLWPANWITCPGCEAPSFVAAYRLPFAVGEAASARVHVTADQRYELFLDGKRIGRGSERGDTMHWFYESYDLPLEPGEHVLVARVWSLDQEGGLAPFAQISFRPGFLLAAEAPFTDRLSTGRAPWEAKRLDGYDFIPSPLSGAGRFAGGTVAIDGRRFPWGFERGAGEGWQAVVTREEAQDKLTRWGEFLSPRLQPAMLPPMLELPRQLGVIRYVDSQSQERTQEVRVDPAADLDSEHTAWQGVFSGQAPHTVAPHSRRRVIVDLENYYCAYAQVTVSGGRDSKVRLHWAEALYEGDEHDNRKGHRDIIEQKRFIGRGDSFIADGGQERTFDGLWWVCGRYLELYVETADEPLTVETVTLRETRYPLEQEGALELSDERFNRVLPLMWRTLQMDAHETYADGPYYEQLMYAGDTRLQALITLVSTFDDRLPRKALRLFAVSQAFNGLTQARYPSYLPQLIPQFSLFWVGMVYDYALWRGDRAFIHSLMPRVRAVLEVFLAGLRDDGLVTWPEGWDWADWVPEWRRGAPPHDGSGLSAINHWLLVMVLGHAAALERWLGETALAERLERVRREIAKRTTEVFWDEERGLFADTPSRSNFSEHAQCYALLSGLLNDEQYRRVKHGLLHDTHLTRATFFFQHYLFEAFYALGQGDALLERLGAWYGMAEQGLKTVLEQPEPARSDCHAWSSHPIYHGVASLVGIRPDGFGFESVTIAPCLGSLSSASTQLPHPRGAIEVALTRKDGTLSAQVTLPEGLQGTLLYGGRSLVLQSGKQELNVPDERSTGS